MKFNDTSLSGASVIEPDLLGDERGWFTRTYDEAEFGRRGLAPVGVQCNASFNSLRDTLRGLHFQREPHGEAKLVRCVRGAIWDVGVDLRPESPSYCRWHAVELTADNRLAYYLPAGFAHGFQTLTEDCEVQYMMGHVYVPQASDGVRWDDPAFGIDWPEPAGERTISAKDVAFPRLRTVSCILVTGASGFIGQRVVAPLVAGGHDVHAVSRGAGGADGVDGVTWHAADLLASADVVGAVRPDVLVHVAWYAEPGKYWTSTENVRWVEASLALLRAFAAAGGRRAVLAGSCAEYDWTTGVDRLSESETPLAPATLYGAAKKALHEVAAAHAEQEGYELAWGRVFFLYGPGEAPSRLFASVARDLLSGRPARTTDGRQVRDFLHVDDVGAAFAALAGSDVKGAVNIGSGEGVALRTVIEEIARAAGRPELLELGAVPRRPGEPDRLVADITRLRDEVGFRPRVARADGVADTVAWWRGRPET